MRIRGKIVVIVLPLVITPVLFAGLISSLLARNGITGVAAQFLQFKGEQISSYAGGQWNLLRENGLDSSPEFVEAAIDAVAGFSQTVLRADGELIFAVSPDGSVGFAVGAVPTAGLAQAELRELAGSAEPGWNRLVLGGTERVAHATRFEPLDWTIYVSELEAVFYEAPNTIIRQLAIVLAVSIAVAVTLLIFFAAYLTRPLGQIASAMTDIIKTNDLSRRVDVIYNDETGVVGQRFNLMISRLEDAYSSIKREALRTAIAQRKEQKTRKIFEKYVPAHVIDEIFEKPEEMLVGQSRVLAILFSDIRSFTSMSEGLSPEEVVVSLNQYFKLMVDAITDPRRGGLVDKYMGDAIMAFFGAPVKNADDAYQAVLAGLDMLDALKDFNVWQKQRDMPEFKIGIGINYGAVTVGNMGSDVKMDYTVIGDMVNLASRLEGLTKTYRQPLIVSESVIRKVEDKLPHRLMDRVVVKGRTMGVGVYSIRRELNAKESEAWSLYDEAMNLYYGREFEKAGDTFAEVLALVPEDHPARSMVERCETMTAHPPADDWTGVVEMTEK